MEMTVLSHAGLSVTGGGVQLLCDPWLVGSTYWRSWWNYPPVPPDLVASLDPTHIYLTHVHWDHFQGASLKKFDPSTTIVVPGGPYGRMKRDLNSLGFMNVVELDHRETMVLAPGFEITSYHFGLFLDSALVIKCDGTTILNANDAKLMGGPLRQVLRDNPKIDFVLRSHSSANSRLSFEITDKPGAATDDESAYISSFATFAQRTGARYAVPFASNHCFLHRDVFHLNSTIKTPLEVQAHFAEHGITSPEIQIMTPGRSWSSESGFSPELHAEWFDDRDRRLAEYAKDKADKLAAFYEKEDRTILRVGQAERYFKKLTKTLPFPIRRAFRDHPITWVLKSGDDFTIIEINLSNGSVKQLDTFDDVANPIQVHTGALIMQRCMARDLFSHLAISKRVRYRVSSANKRYIVAMNLIFNLYEYDMLPARRIFSKRSVRSWSHRWRELLLYARIATDLARGRGLKADRYM